MYRDYYLEVKDVADRIRQNPTSDPTPDRPTGFMQPKKANVASALEAAEEESFNKVLLKYMDGIRKSSVTARYEDSIPVEARGDLQKALAALGQIESSNNYQAKGPVVKKGAYKGQRAMGKYQVMEGNIGPWSREVLGFELTTEEFLSNPKYQDMIAGAKMSQSKAKYGSWDDAASVWFSGRPMAKAGNASDGYNTVPQYVMKFRKAWENLQYV